MSTRTELRVITEILIMKTFLSTLILSAGISLSAAAATSLLDSSIVGYSNFGSQTADFGTQKDSVSITTDSSNLTLELSGATFNSLVGDTKRDVMTVTMVLDLSKINTPGAYTPLFIATDGTTNWGVGLTTDRKLKGYWSQGVYSNGPTTGVLDTSGLLTVSVVTGEDGTRIYFGDKDTYYSQSGLKFGKADIDKILVNSSLAGSVEQLYVHNTNLSQTDVGTLMTQIASIPEPATATLGLLGLAALMTRRRRA